MEYFCGCCSGVVDKPANIINRALANSKSGLVFCSRSCASTKTNKLFAKKKPGKWFCQKCNAECRPSRKLCSSCISHGHLGDITLGEATYEKHHRSSAFALVRARARAQNTETSCRACGYSKHIEVAHINPIASYPLDTLLSKINDPSNLISLCPNCHWEYDHGLLKI